MRFRDLLFSDEGRYAIGTELDSERYFVSIPASDGYADYGDYYAISPQQFEVPQSDKSAAVEFVEACRRRQHDDLLILQPGNNRGTPVG